MRKPFLYLATALIISSLSFSACSKKAKEESKEAAEAVKEDMKDAAKSTGETIKDVATDVKKGAQDVASEVKDAAKETASDVKHAAKATASTIKNASNEAVAAVDAKLSKMSEPARMEYHALDKEISRIDGEISQASDAEKVKLKRTRARLVKKRDDLLSK